MNRNDSILDRWLTQLDAASSDAAAVEQSEIVRFLKNHDAAPSMLASLVPPDRREPLIAIAAFLAFTGHVARRSPPPDESVKTENKLEDPDSSAATDDTSDNSADTSPPLLPIDLWTTLIRSTENLKEASSKSDSHPVLDLIAPLRTTGRIDTALLIRAAEDARHRTLNTHANSWDTLAASRQREAATTAQLIFPLLAAPTSESMLRSTSAILGALYLTRELRSLNRDVLTRGRLVLPAEFFPDADFEARLIRSAKLGHGVDHDILRQSVHVVRECTRRLWDLYEFGRPGIDNLTPIGAAALDAVGEYGQILLQTIEQWNCEVMLHEPTIGATRRIAWRYKFRKALRRAEHQLIANNPDKSNAESSTV